MTCGGLLRALKSLPRAQRGGRLGGLAIAGLLAAYPHARLPAQVGHPPDRSPYQDIPRAAGPVISVGYLPGVAGKVGVGITSITTVGARYDLALSGALRVSFGMSYGMGERFIVDPTKDTATRTSGPESDGFLLVDGEVHLLLTGHKTWRGLAPFVTAGAGLVMGGAEPAADTSAYQLGTRFVLDGGVGLRWYPSRRLSVQLDTRVFLLQLRYPDEFYVFPVAGGPPVLREGDDQEEWTRQPWFRVGVGWTF
jgi:hypothetical protein